ncbi:MAG: 3-dehydroquinate synthase [Lachnospiraceae bacterium]|nr:3-dehydroquinate synthase [Lachnospiraceae bacterium]
MDKIVVDIPGKSYPIYFTGSFLNIPSFLEENLNNAQKALIVCDSNVYKLFEDEVFKICKKVFKKLEVFVFFAGEASKNLETIKGMYALMLKSGLDRNSCVIALGGGVAGDMAGFAAATYMRGIDFVQIPTTLLADVDSSVGGKVGVDFSNSKNIIGAFYQPKFVYINVSVLSTLPAREFSAGLAEVIKYGASYSKELYKYVILNKEKLKALDEDVLKETIKKCCAIKAEIVAKDEKESGLREILNFGHTIGHAVESASGFNYLHGECVSIGMVAVFYISMRMGLVSGTEAESLKNLLSFFDLPLKAEGLNIDDVYELLFHDKKTRDNKIKFILPNGLGKYIKSDEIAEALIRDAIAYVLK